MATFWFAVIVGRLPDEFVDGIVLEDGMDEEGDVSPETLKYAILARAKSSTHLEAQELIAEATKALQPGYFFLIADRADIVVRSERRVAESLNENDVSLKASFLGFSRESEVARTSAIEILEQAVKRTWWQFWR